MPPVPLAVVLLVDPRGWGLLQERDEGAPRALLDITGNGAFE